MLMAALPFIHQILNTTSIPYLEQHNARLSHTSRDYFLVMGVSHPLSQVLVPKSREAGAAMAARHAGETVNTKHLAVSGGIVPDCTHQRQRALTLITTTGTAGGGGSAQVGGAAEEGLAMWGRKLGRDLVPSSLLG